MANPRARTARRAAAVATTLCVLAALAATVLPGLASATGTNAPDARSRTHHRFTYQPITVHRINLPRRVKSAGWPVFTHDGRHLLFFSTGANTDGGSTGPGKSAALWIVNLDGSHAHCLTCGVTNDPTSSGEGVITPFPDGRRVFFGSFHQPGSSKYAVLQCTPSVVNCRKRSILPVDFSAAEPKVVPPGDGVLVPGVNLGGSYSAKLSQDGHYVGFSDLRTDSIEPMVIGRLTRGTDTYSVTDPKVINPPGPTSGSDRNSRHWSDGGSLFEFKTFTNGGADATYVQVGGAGLQNPDVWSVNLATGKRTRLTANADYDEDNAISPNGRLLALWSNRTMHMTDWLGGLMPVRDYIDAPAALLGLGISSSNKRCHGPVWVLPSDGDRGGRLLGQPITYNRAAHVFVTNNLVGWPQWSPDGTRLALNTTDERAGNGYPAHAPFLLVAHFTALKPSRPIRPVSSAPGSWAKTPTTYHSAFGHLGTMTLKGRHSGTVKVTNLGALGVLGGTWSETYTDYSDNGRDVVNGKVSITSAVESGRFSSHLTMTGAHRGSTDVDITFDQGAKGHGRTTYDGTTVRGPSKEQAARGACPRLRPKAPKLHVRTTRARRGRIHVKVTVRVRGAGANEGTTRVIPVRHARVHFGGRVVFTDRRGVAVVRPHGSQVFGTLRVSAGNTLRPATVHLKVS